jgi:hypothetical protein
LEQAHNPQTLHKTISIRYALPGDEELLLPDSVFTDTVSLGLYAKGWQLLRMGNIKEWILPYDMLEQSERKKEKFLIEQLENRTGHKLQIKRITWKTSPRTPYYTAKKVPVSLQYDFRAAPGYHIKDISIIPDSVWIFGPREDIEKIHEILTPHMTLHNIKNDKFLKIPLEFPSGISGLSGKIKVRITVKPFVRKEIEIPVEIPPGWENRLLLFPSSVRIYYKAYPAVTGRKNPVNLWHVRIHPDSIGKTTYLTPQISETPPGVFDIQMEPRKLDYLIRDEK